MDDAKTRQPAAKRRPPGTAMTRWPKRSASRPPIAALIAAMSGPGVTETPARRTDQPHTEVRNRMLARSTA